MVPIVFLEVLYNFGMNHRDYKEFARNETYHIFNRGVGKIDIFKDKEDYGVFLYRLKENLFPELFKDKNVRKNDYRRKYLPSDSFDLISYCLMPNHFHLIIQQKTDLPISALMLKLCGGFSKYFNKKYGRVGSLFQDQFKSVLVGNNEQLLWLSFYVHNNPLKAGVTKNLSTYEWSSFPDYSEARKGTLCKKDLILEQFHSTRSYLEYFKNPSENQEIQNKLIGHRDLLIDED